MTGIIFDELIRLWRAMIDYKLYGTFAPTRFGKPSKLKNGMTFLALVAVHHIQMIGDFLPYEQAMSFYPIVLAVYIGIPFFLYKREWPMLLFLSISSYINLENSGLISNNLRYILKFYLPEIPELAETLIVYLFYFMISGLVVYFICRLYTYKKQRLRPTELLFLSIPFVLSIVMGIVLRYILMESTFRVHYTYGQDVIVAFMVGGVGILLQGNYLATVGMLQRVIRLNLEDRNRIILENQISEIQRRVDNVQDIYTEIRGMKHDMRNHLSNIRLLFSGGDVNEPENEKQLSNYLGEMENALDQLDFSHSTGDPILDVILRQKQQEAQKHGISFSAECQWKKGTTASVYDIAVILSNALDNAIEACKKMPGGRDAETDKGFVNVQSYYKGDLFFIQVENPFDGTLIMDQETGLPITTKREKDQHGIGMSNIQRCAQKHMGGLDVKVRQSDGVSIFVLTVMMQALDVEADIEAQ